MEESEGRGKREIRRRRFGRCRIGKFAAFFAAGDPLALSTLTLRNCESPNAEWRREVGDAMNHGVSQLLTSSSAAVNTLLSNAFVDILFRIYTYTQSPSSFQHFIHLFAAMKFTSAALLAITATACQARFIESHESDVSQVILNPQHEDLYKIELSPTETRLVTEDEKWELRRQGINFMDITDTEDLASYAAFNTARLSKDKFPSSPSLQKEVKPMLKTLSKLEMKNHLETYTAFYTRYYKSTYGAQASEWLLKTVNNTVVDAGAHKYGATVEHFHHPWGQNSIIAHFPGKSNKTIVIGAHLDSTNLFLPSVLSAPGADDDGSGTVTILEAMRVLLTSDDFIKGKADNTVEFHWYSAEEGGLLGSQAIFQQYSKLKRDVRAMLQQDMTGYVQKTLNAGEPESVGVITDFVDPELTDYIKKIVTEVCSSYIVFM